jgi:regulator of protease activity HflC (stomatin/prohibitin superfamily)
MGVDAILTSDRAAFRERVQQRVQELTEAENLGVSVDQVDIDASAPLYLRGKFNEVVGAAQTRQTRILQAQAYATTNVLHAMGEAANVVNLAETARTNMVAMVAAQADTFLKQRAQYESNPELFKRIKQMSVLEHVYTNVDDKIVVPPNSHELRFELNREPQAPVNNIPTKP